MSAALATTWGRMNRRFRRSLVLGVVAAVLLAATGSPAGATSHMGTSR